MAQWSLRLVGICTNSSTQICVGLKRRVLSISFQVEIKEEERVAGMVASIDEEAGVVPRGAYVMGPLGDVMVNRSFQGQKLIIEQLFIHKLPGL